MTTGMPPLQKIAALVIRLVSVGMVVYALVIVVTLALTGMLLQGAWLVMPWLVAGNLLYLGARALALLVTRGLDD
jgi:hypothetical protein